MIIFTEFKHDMSMLSTRSGKVLKETLFPVLKKYLNSHPTRKGNAWKFVKTLHVKFFPFGRKMPARRVTVKLENFDFENFGNLKIEFQSQK